MPHDYRHPCGELQVRKARPAATNTRCLVCLLQPKSTADARTQTKKLEDSSGFRHKLHDELLSSGALPNILSGATDEILLDRVTPCMLAYTHKTILVNNWRPL